MHVIDNPPVFIFVLSFVSESVGLVCVAYMVQYTSVDSC